MLSNLSGFSIVNPKKRRAFQEITGTFNVPEISFASATTSSVVTTITNYDASMTYVVSSSEGSASRVTDTVTVSGLTSNQSVTTTVTATGSTGLEFSTTTPSFPSLPATPTLSRSGGTTTTVTVVIGNYDAGLTYTIGSTVGSATRSGDTIDVTGLTQGQAVTVTATASNASGSSAQGSLATGAVPATPTLSFSSSTETTATFSITNYNAAYTYSVSSSSGSASRSGSTITVTGLSENTSVTAFATATANGIASAQGSASGTTQLGGAYEQIATYYASQTFTSYTFSNIPQTYSHLVVKIFNAPGSGATTYFRFNSVQTDTYITSRLTPGTSNLTTNTDTAAAQLYQFSGTATNASNCIDMEIFDYSSTNQKKTIFFPDTYLSYYSLQGGGWVNDAAINSVTVFTFAPNYLGLGTRISLYGVKA